MLVFAIKNCKFATYYCICNPFIALKNTNRYAYYSKTGKILYTQA